MLTQERLKEVLRYEPLLGEFYWLVEKGARARMGTKAGSISKSTGYVEIGIDGKVYLAHRLAFFYMLGRWPKPQGDHENRRRWDNRWTNLRDATHSQNLRNANVSRSNKTGHNNITKDKKTGKYRVILTINKKLKTFGHFFELKNAVCVRDAWSEFYQLKF